MRNLSNSPKGGLTTQWSNRLFIAGLTAIVMAVSMASCNVTRTITTSSEAYKRGDTSIVIQTKTIETYDASKKLMY